MWQAILSGVIIFSVLLLITYFYVTWSISLRKEGKKTFYMPPDWVMDYVQMIQFWITYNYYAVHW